MLESDWLGDVAAAPVTRGRPAARPGHPKTRSRKLECHGCGFIARASRGALVRAGMPSCGCGERMALADLRDRAAVDWDALAAELESYGRGAYDAAMRELGYTDMIAPRDTGGRGGGPPKRCAVWQCHRFTAAEYCAEHAGHRPEVTAARRVA
jgi:hypothetical protein